MNIFELNQFFNQLNLAIIQKKLVFISKFSQDLSTILQGLQKSNFIVGYSKNHSNNIVKIFLRYDIKGNCVIKKVKFVSSQKQRIIINNKQLKVFLNNYPYAVGFIRTY
jgi:ribosomal protein S8